MGGSNSGGGGAAEVNFDASQLNQELSALRDPNSQQAQAISGLISGQLTPEAKLAQDQALAAIEGGRQGAVQGARESAASRGLFSSDIGIGLEQNALQNLAGQKANIYQQQAQNIQSGVLSGLQAGQNMMGLRGNLASSIATGQLSASQTNAQLQQQYNTQQQQYGYDLAKTGGALVAAPFTGGASLGLLVA